MNSIVIRVVFESEPPPEVRLEAESGLVDIMKLLDPQSKPEIRSGQGSFWISASIAAAVWLALESASWIYQKYIMNPIGQKVESILQRGDEINEVVQVETEGERPGILPWPQYEDLSRVPDSSAALAFILLVNLGKQNGVTEVTIKQLKTDPTSPTGIRGIALKLIGISTASPKLELVQVDTRDDFFAV